MASKTTIRDLRESKNLSQDAVAEAAGLTYNAFCRIEAGTGKTTPDEISAVLGVLEQMQPGTRKLAGRPFKDPVKQAAVAKARAEGKSVSAALASVASTSAPAPAEKAAAPAKKAPAKAAAKKAPAKKAPAAKKGAKSLAGALGKKAPAKKAAAAQS